MPIDLIGHLDRLVRRVDNQQFDGAADRMADALSDGARAAMGGDLTFSGGGGTVRIKGRAERGRVVVEAGGAYALANKGRRSVVQARAARGSALATPRGPRASAKGSTWRGFDITNKYGDKAFRAGIDGVMDEVDWGR